jgi:hypothetical protein
MIFTLLPLNTFAANRGIDESSMIALFDRWLFSAAPEVPFLRHLDGSEEPNMIYRAADRFEKRSGLSELALRLATCGTCEPDAERLLSMQAISQDFTGRASVYRPWKRASKNGLIVRRKSR